MVTLKKILWFLALATLSGFLALLATNIYYFVYKSCAGSSVGLAFGLTFGIVPISAVFIFLGGALSKTLAVRKESGKGIQLVSRFGGMVLISALTTVFLLASLYPYPRDQDSGQ
jgi:hypothetical protein